MGQKIIYGAIEHLRGVYQGGTLFAKLCSIVCYICIKSSHEELVTEFHCSSKAPVTPPRDRGDGAGDGEAKHFLF